MPDTETVAILLSGINPDLQLPRNSGEVTQYRTARRPLGNRAAPPCAFRLVSALNLCMFVATKTKPVRTP
jgi:hypothetical protein